MQAHINITEEQRTEARKAIDIALERNQRLTALGIGYYTSEKMPVSEYVQEFRRSRADLENYALQDEVATALAYLRNLQPLKTPTQGSYWLKHRAEKWGKAHSLSAYVTNGSLIAAAMYLNLPTKEDPESLNVLVGVSKRSAAAIAPSDDTAF